MKYFIFSWFAFLILIFAIYTWGAINEIPKCEEDQVLVGTGQFEDGRWSNYYCGPSFDDFWGLNENP